MTIFRQERLRIIMKTYWLTIAGLVVLTLVVIIAAKVFWLAETAPKAQYKNIRQKQQRVVSNSQAWPKPQQSVAEHLTPTFRSKTGRFQPRRAKKMAGCDWNMLKHHMNIADVRRASQLLHRLPQRVQRRYDFNGKEELSEVFKPAQARKIESPEKKQHRAQPEKPYQTSSFSGKSGKFRRQMPSQYRTGGQAKKAKQLLRKAQDTKQNDTPPEFSNRP